MENEFGYAHNELKMRRLSNFQWLLISAACVFAVWIVGTASLYLKYRMPDFLPRGANDSILSWAFGVFWASHAPLIFILSRRLTFERKNQFKSLLFYLSAGIVWAMLIQGLPLLLLPFFNDSASYGSRQFRFIFINWFGTYFLPNTFFYWLVLSVSLISSYYERYQKEKIKTANLDAQLSNARLQALKMQLQPHFLFNTLHSISALVLKNENRDAVKMINRLSELLRLSLDNIETQTVSLEEEIEFTRRYLEIELIRFKDRLEVEWEIDANALNAKVPNLILQPLVENAMRHAVDLHSGTSRIKISANLKNKQIFLEVSDDGKNFEKISAQNGASGLGLKNTRARLAELYGEDFRFELDRKNDWTTAQIVILFSPVKEISEGENH